MFITNVKSGEAASKSMKTRLTELMCCSKQLDMLVGFFYFSGVEVMTQAFRDNPSLKLRVLVGMEADEINGRIVEMVSALKGASAEAMRAEFYASLRRVVGSQKMDTKAFHDRIDIFITMLKEERLEVRKTQDPNHAKLYIFSMNEAFKTLSPVRWITGSSNFSEPGLKVRDEFNVEISDFGTEEAQHYFERLWEDAIPLTENDEQRRVLVDILEGESITSAATPFEAYYLVLQHYLEHQKIKLNEGLIDRILEKAKFKKYRYQVDAVAQALAKIEQYKGVIIADVVGLGKSIIAGLLAGVRMKRGLILCPPGLMGDANGTTGGWHAYVQDFGLIHWQVWSSGNLKAVLDLLKRDPAFDMVIVDEAHKFRNEETESYAMLKEICFGREVVLLTATPYNNRPNDLLALLHLFSSGKQSPFVPGGDIDGVFKKFTKDSAYLSRLNRAIAKNDWDQIMNLLPKIGQDRLVVQKGKDLEKVRGIAGQKGKALNKKIRQIMDKVVIRRNRIDLLNDPDYSKEITTLSTVNPPEAQYFELTKEQNRFYDRVITDYFGENGVFRGAIYRPQEYLKNKAGQDDAQNNLFIMMRNLLIMRFESSFGAFRQTLVNITKILENALTFIDRMGAFIYSRKDIEKILEEADGDNAYEMMLEVVQRLEQKYLHSSKRGKHQSEGFYQINDPAFNGEAFVSDIKADLKLFKTVIQEVDELNLASKDPKTVAVIQVAKSILEGKFHDDKGNGAKKRKVLLFSVYGDTIKYLQKSIEDAFPGRVLSVTGENFTATMAKTVKENFDASFETQKDDFDILLATDKLSEGFNLNRAGVVVNYDIPWNPTRVIQRVGRINRIGKKVFEDLYILNFFPTVKGAKKVQNREVAEIKMFAIHSILGEDAQIFSVEEEPTAAALFDKLCKIDNETVTSFYSEIKLEYAKATKFLEENHPEDLQRIKRYPHMIKTAFEGNPTGTFMFRRQGANFYAIVHNRESDTISLWTLEDAMNAIKCKYETKRIPFTPEFWVRKKAETGDNILGVYEALKAYEPEKGVTNGGLSSASAAIVNINNALPELSKTEQMFAKDVIEDIQSYGTIAPYTIKLLATAKSNEVLKPLLKDICLSRGANYLSKVKTEAIRNDVIVTIEKQ